MAGGKAGFVMHIIHATLNTINANIVRPVDLCSIYEIDLIVSGRYPSKKPNPNIPRTNTATIQWRYLYPPGYA